MDTSLSAVGYCYNIVNYGKECQRILNGIYTCYTLMLKDNVLVPFNDENEIRNILLRDYLNNDMVRNQTDLIWYTFNKEVPEENGRVDIKVEFRNHLIPVKAYYIIECKRLDSENLKGVTGLNAKYIENGIYRFVSKLYPTNCGINAMIGFVVEAMDIRSNVENNINFLLKNSFTNCNTTKVLHKESFIPGYEFHFVSEHNDIDNVSFTLYHLMFDFSKNIISDKSQCPLSAIYCLCTTHMKGFDCSHTGKINT